MSGGLADASLREDNARHRGRARGSGHAGNARYPGLGPFQIQIQDVGPTDMSIHYCHRCAAATRVPAATRGEWPDRYNVPAGQVHQAHGTGPEVPGSVRILKPEHQLVRVLRRGHDGSRLSSNSTIEAERTRSGQPVSPRASCSTGACLCSPRTPSKSFCPRAQARFTPFRRTRRRSSGRRVFVAVRRSSTDRCEVAAQHRAGPTVNAQHRLVVAGGALPAAHRER